MKISASRQRKAQKSGPLSMEVLDDVVSMRNKEVGTPRSEDDDKVDGNPEILVENVEVSFCGNSEVDMADTAQPDASKSIVV